ncbi:hypothetical protein KSP39_PZI022758 [Platanthera zijinensis]|uniref:Uncharacterized protein n=1 Tax=Platanthera zijinensis TaxID=2320716 RepID=A0AAP0AWJ8_9ASPA
MPKNSAFLNTRTGTSLLLGACLIIFGLTMFLVFMFAAIISKLLPKFDNKILSAIQNDSTQIQNLTNSIEALITSVNENQRSCRPPNPDISESTAGSRVLPQRCGCSTTCPHDSPLTATWVSDGPLSLDARPAAFRHLRKGLLRPLLLTPTRRRQRHTFWRSLLVCFACLQPHWPDSCICHHSGLADDPSLLQSENRRQTMTSFGTIALPLLSRYDTKGETLGAIPWPPISSALVSPIIDSHQSLLRLQRFVGFSTSLESCLFVILEGSNYLVLALAVNCH